MRERRERPGGQPDPEPSEGDALELLHQELGATPIGSSPDPIDWHDLDQLVAAEATP